MQDLAWYDGPSLTDPAELLALRANYRADSLIVSHALWLENRAYKSGLKSLCAREQLVVSGAVFEREINSGGFEGFLDTYRAYLDSSVLCMMALGQSAIADLIVQANVINLTNPDDDLGHLDEQYYALGLDLADDLIRLATSAQS